MGKRMNLSTLQAASTANKAPATDAKATFLANPMRITVVDEVTGETILSTVAQSRGFKAKEKNGVLAGGVGWYADVRKDDCGTYRNLPVEAGIRLSLSQVKVSPADEIDLRTDADGQDLAGGDGDAE